MQNKIRIPKEEFGERIKNIQSEMKKADFDCIIAFGHTSEPALIRYLSDFVTSFETAGVAIPKTGEPFLLVGPENEVRAKRKSIIKNVKGMHSFREPSAPEYLNISNQFEFKDLFNIFLNGNQLKKIGIAGWTIIPKMVYDDIRNAAEQLNDGVEIVVADYVMNKVRMKKSINEIRCIQKSAEISRKALEYVVENIREGMTGTEVKGLALSKMYAEGAEGEAFPMWITREEETVSAISIPSKEKFQKGDLIQIQMGANYEGYCSAVGRPIVIGEASEFQRGFIESVKNLKLAIERALEESIGKKAEIVAITHQNEAGKMGKEHMLCYGPCHSVGLVECEDPWIEVGADFILEENMVFCVDIFLSDPYSERGIRFEDTILIKGNNIERLTDFHHSLIEIMK